VIEENIACYFFTGYLAFEFGGEVDIKTVGKMFDLCVAWL